MDVLPIDQVRDEDAPLVGAELVNLARLAHLKFPVARGLVVIPPEIHLKTTLKYFNLKDKEVFEQNLTIIKKEIAKIPIPEELEEKLTAHKLNSKKIWQDLLDLWLEEIRKRIWGQGFFKGITENLTAQSVFFTTKVYSSGKAFNNPENQEVVIESFTGILNTEQKLDLEKIVNQGNKKLFLPQEYYFITESPSGKAKLVRLAPFTHYQEPKKEYGVFEGLAPKENPKSGVSSAIKVFLKSPKNYVLNQAVDGVLVAAEESKNLEEKIFKLVETASSIDPNQVIFKFSDIEDQKGGVRGALRLNHQESLLKEDVEVFSFARHKKGLINLSFCIPFVRSVSEFLQIKRNLASQGISRKGTLKLWLEVSVPENIINLEDYLVAGVDGIILNLDELSSWLGGFDQQMPESVFYKGQIAALLKFIEDGLKLMHKSKIPFLALGNLSLHDDVLYFLMEKGVYGLIVDLANAQGIGDHLRFAEKRLIRARST